MKKVVSFNLELDHLQKIDDIKFKKAASRSAVFNAILNEYFSLGDSDLIDELAAIKRQNRELNYQLEKLTKKMMSQNKEMLAMLIILGGQNDQTKEMMMKRFPHYWAK